MINRKIKPLSVSRLLLLALAVLVMAACGDSGEAESTELSADTASIKIGMQVYKSPSCGCCSEWIDHVEAHGFSVTATDSDRMIAIKHAYDIEPQYQSCHTADVNGYVFEGHVPATVIQRFLADRPTNALGLAVPGMPIGSPGMEMGERFDDYDVLLLKTDGSSEVYQRIDDNFRSGL